MVNIAVVGCGYLGAVHSAAMASVGHFVVGVDIDGAKIETLSQFIAPFYEPGLPEILDELRTTGRLTYTSDLSRAAQCSVYFIAVGTPQKLGSMAADVSHVEEAVASLVPFLSPGDLVVGKSTVPVGTASRLSELIESTGAMLAWNPEFLREGFAIQDTVNPDRIVYGVPSGSDGERATAILNEVYADALSRSTPVVVTDYATAELVKVAANAFLATKISFINAMAEISEATGADVTALADAIGHDNRIGRRFLNAGVGFGGGCLPKDIRAFTARAEELGCGESVAFLKEVDAINLRRRVRMLDMAIESLGGSVNGKHIAVLGLAFKPHSDDIRDSPALDIAVQLKGLGAHVVGHDPEAISNARKRHPQLNYAETANEALEDAEAIIVVTEWPEYRELDPMHVSELTNGRVIIDGRNCLDAEQWRDAGFTYRGLGRPDLPRKQQNS